MRFSRTTALATALLMIWVPAFAGWQSDLAEVLEMDPGSDRDRRVAKIARAEPDWQEVAAYIQSIEFPEVKAGSLILESAMCTDDVERPYVLYIPPGYDPAAPTPLLVRLHGGVARADIVPQPLEYAEGDEFLPVAEREGWFVLYPFGQEGATWWDKVGMANIRNLVRIVKRLYNIDDDRVWMEGFSDGASACFTHAMVSPNDYAAFVPLNGHMGVGSLDGDLPLHAPNLFNSPLYAVTTKGDDLYPSDRMRTTIEVALEAGGDIIYRELEGTHDFDYAESEMPRVVRFLKRHPRDPFPSRIVWEAGDPAYGDCRWFGIEKVTIEESSPWHKDYNAALVDDRITIGFVPDYSFEEDGVKVSSVLEKTAAEEMGLEKEDIIVEAEGMSIGNLDDLVKYKGTLKRGDRIELTVLRGEGRGVLEAHLPEISNYLVFKRDIPSGLAQADFHANRIRVRTSRVGAFSIYVHPDMVNLDDDLIVTWNGETVHDRPVKPDIGFLIENFLENRDRSLLCVAKLEFKTPKME
jgi:predicted esterase